MISYIPGGGRINLIPFTIELLQSILAGDEVLYSKFGITLPTTYTNFPESIEYAINHFNENDTKPPFQSFAIISKNSSTYIGQAGFLSPPDANGTVEFGYEIALNFQGQGYADEVLKIMVHTAFEEPIVKSIIAHTLNTKNASNHLLIKNHFVFDGAVAGTEDGTVWRWLLTRRMHVIKQLF